MANDPKINRPPAPALSQPKAPASSPPKPPPNVRVATADSTGHAKKSSFDSQPARAVAEFSEGVGDLSEGRKVRGGVADDSVGRKQKGGVADDSVGVGDLSEGRKTRGGVADDSVGVGDLAEGRKTRGGVADDSVGVGDDAEGRKVRGGVADDSVGRTVRGGVADDSVGRKQKGGVADDSVGVEVGRDLDPTHVALREAIFERLETPRYLDVEQPPPSKPADLASVSRQLSATVTASHAASLLAAAKHDPVVGARLDSVLRGTDGLPADTRAALVDALAIEGPTSNAARVIEEITHSNAWKRLTNSQKVQLADVMTSTTPRGLEHLGALIEAAPNRLLEQDTLGHTLLSNLNELASQPLNASLYRHTTTPELVESVLRDVVNPERIDQGDTTTCTVTSMQYELVNDDRAEYVRLLVGLTGQSGTVKMHGGIAIKASSDDSLDTSRHERSISSALFQSAAIEYANGRDDFDPISGKSTKYDGSKVYGGLNPEQQARMLGQLFGVKYSVDNLQSEAEGARALETMRGFDAAQHPNRPVLIDIDQGDINHTVTLERIADGRILFRDPYGELRSMPESAFAKVVVGLHKPMEA